MTTVAIPAPVVWHPGPAFRRLREILLMAGSAGDVYEARVLDLLFGQTAIAAIGTTYIGLWGTAGAINDASTGATAGEISGGSYARVAFTNNTTNWPASTGTAPTVKKNGVAITFPTATADWNSGNVINQVAALDGNAGTTADKIIVWGDLTTPKRILNGDTGQFAINDFQITCD